MADRIKQGNKSSVDLTKAYQTASEKLITVLRGGDAQGVKIRFSKLLQSVQIELDTLNAREVEKAVRAGAEQSISKFNSALDNIFNGRAFTVKDLTAAGLSIENQKAAEAILERRTENLKKSKVYRQNFLELRGQLAGVCNALQTEVNDTLHKLAGKDANTVSAAIGELRERLKESGCLNVRYSNGASVGVDGYANMVCRSARTESANIENLKAAQAFGTDLVECIGNAITCEVCAQFRGRIFSISGKDKRYPPLRGGVNSPLKNGYDLIHPNCRCEFRAYFEALHAPEENDEKRRFSNRPFEGDKRTDAQRRAYQEWQSVQRRAIDERYRYNEMREVLGADMQYADLSSLRRALRSDKDSFAYKKSHYAVRDYRQYERWKEIVGKENLPESLAAFQELKYNKTEVFESLKLKIKDERVTKDIKTNYPLDIQKDKQGKHIEGNKNYIAGKSKITISMEECQDIVNKFATNGEYSYDKNGNWQHKEIAKTNKIVGKVVYLDGTEKATHSMTIHYSKNGTHIVPKEDEKK